MEILERLIFEHPSLISPNSHFPRPFIGKGEIKVIILGADPTHIVEGKPLQINMVFGLDLKDSPYWRGIRKNLSHITGLTQDNIYVQNVCKNYFLKETSKNDRWISIAKEYWLPELSLELNSLFTKEIPIFLTTEIILKACILSDNDFIPASRIYKECLYISEKDNLLGRKLFALYRHFWYSLDRWPNYSSFLITEINKSTKA